MGFCDKEILLLGSVVSLDVRQSFANNFHSKHNLYIHVMYLYCQYIIRFYDVFPILTFTRFVNSGVCIQSD